MNYSHEVENMCIVKKDACHKPAPIPQEGKWTKATEIKDISGLTHGIGWCAPQQGMCKLTLNVKEGVIEEALVETCGCSGMTHSAAMAGEILPGKTILEALNSDLVCDAINTAMRELFLQIVYGRSQTAFSEGGLPIGAGPKGEIWKIEDSIYPFIELCTQILSEDALFFLVNSYTTGLQPAVLTYMIHTAVVTRFGGKVEASEIGLPVKDTGLVLPCGASGRWTKG